MFKYPSPAELELDEIRGKMWQDAGRNPDKLVQLIKQRARQAQEDSVKPGGFRFVRDGIDKKKKYRA